MFGCPFVSGGPVWSTPESTNHKLGGWPPGAPYVSLAFQYGLSPTGGWLFPTGVAKMSITFAEGCVEGCINEGSTGGIEAVPVGPILVRYGGSSPSEPDDGVGVGEYDGGLGAVADG